MENLLELNGVCKSYPAFSLKDVSFSLPAGSIMGFIGENGAGKTTTIKLILNEVKRSAGTISIFGKDNIKDEITVKQDIGAVFDESYFFDGLTAADIGKILSRVFKAWDQPLYEKYQKDFELSPKKKIEEYSKGMKMKLSIASALSHHPRLLILDEATSGLDPVMRSEILDLFLDFIQDEGCSVLFSSHITPDLERIADYVTFIHKGSIVLSLPKDELTEKWGIVKCGASKFADLDKSGFMRWRRGEVECEALVRDKNEARREYPGLVVDNATLDDIMLFYVKGEKS
ncbi:MAG TPA: ABC transporter [Ruminococcaceae bacterium]|jgi:ABC-2 type transport system ATP-binding protein|nr:ABC transporter [Oscillospiraceae bacterium]